MDIKILDQQGVEVKAEAEQSSPTLPVEVEDTLLQSVGFMFNLHPREVTLEKERIKLLIDYAKTQTDDRTSEGIKWAIRSLQGKVGTPPLGEKWIPYLSKYAYLKMESLKLNKEVENYERNN